MTARARRRAAAVLIACGVAMLSWSGAGYVRAERFRRAHVTAIADRPAETDRSRSGDVIGVLEIPRLGVCSPILEGDHAGALARGIGHLPDTALPWEHGNTAVAAHRDTVFRPLGRVRAGDAITVTTPRGRFDYTILDTRIVEPTDLSVLKDGARPTLTLITCYPFRMIGRAPKRFVVRAERQASAEAVPSGRPPCGPPRSL